MNREMRRAINTFLVTQFSLKKFNVQEYRVLVPRSRWEHAVLFANYEDKKGLHTVLDMYAVHYSALVEYPAIYMALIRVNLPPGYEKFNITSEEDLIREVIRGLTHETIHIVIHNLIGICESYMYDNIALKVEV